jgi:hypothetical protein
MARPKQRTAATKAVRITEEQHSFLVGQKTRNEDLYETLERIFVRSASVATLQAEIEDLKEAISIERQINEIRQNSVIQVLVK